MLPITAGPTPVCMQPLSDYLISHIGFMSAFFRQSALHIEPLAADRPALVKTTDGRNRLDAILFEGRSEPTRARIAEDARLIQIVESYDGAALANLHGYKTSSGMPQSQVLSDVLLQLHLFNHQTHHRGQAHACLSILTAASRRRLTCWCFSAGALRRTSKS